MRTYICREGPVPVNLSIACRTRHSTVHRNPQDRAVGRHRCKHYKRAAVPDQAVKVCEPTSPVPGRQVEYVDTARQGYFLVQGRLRLRDVHPDTVWKILTSYESSAQIFRNINASSAQVTNKGEIIVLQTVNAGKRKLKAATIMELSVIAQAPSDCQEPLLRACWPVDRASGLEGHFAYAYVLVHTMYTQEAVWRFLAFSGTFECRLAVDEDYHARSLTFRLLESSFMRDFEGRWNVHEEGGDDGRTCVLVEHELSVLPAIPIPGALAFYTRPIFVKQVDSVLQDLEAEIKRLRDGPPLDTP